MGVRPLAQRRAHIRRRNVPADLLGGILNLKSSPALRRRAVTLIDSSTTFAEGSAKELLTSPLGGYGPSVQDLINLATSVRTTLDNAKAIINDPNFTSLDADIQDDVTAIAEEYATLLSEIDEASHPDNVWAGMDGDRKAKVVAQHRLDRVKGDKLHARLTLERRGQGPHPPDPQPKDTPPGKK